MDEKLLHELSQLHLALRSIKEAKEHIYLSQGLSGTTANGKRALQDLETARLMLIADLDFTYRKASAVAGPVGRTHGRESKLS